MTIRAGVRRELLDARAEGGAAAVQRGRGRDTRLEERGTGVRKAGGRVLRLDSAVWVYNMTSGILEGRKRVDDACDVNEIIRARAPRAATQGCGSRALHGRRGEGAQ